MKFRTFIDDSTEGGENTISGITTQGATYGVGISSDIDGVRNFESSGIVTSSGGFISGISTNQLGVSTTPIHITLDGNVLTFTAVGIGSTHFSLYNP